MTTSFHTKLTIIVIGIIGLVLTPYFLWHEQMNAYFVSEPYQEWLVSVKPYAWLIGLGLIVADLFLPIPAPPVKAAVAATVSPPSAKRFWPAEPRRLSYGP